MTTGKVRGPMNSLVARLSFWKRKRSFSGEAQVVSPSHALRDFIYLDVVLVSSYLEQLTGGVPYGAEISREYHGGGEAGVNMPLFQVSIEGGGSRGYRENQTIYWDRYARLEKALRDAAKLVDLTREAGAPATLKANTIFLAAGRASLEPDWSLWQSGISMAKIVFQKLQQLSALEAIQQTQPDESGMVPMLYGPEGTAVVMVKQDALSQLFKDKLPDEPPNKLRPLFKPSGVIIRLHLGDPENAFVLDGYAGLEHFTPHRAKPYLLGPVQEDIHILGLVRQVQGNSVQFIPLAAFVMV